MTLPLRLKGRVALITGGGSGMGLACAERLVAEGAHVVVFDQDETRTTAAATALGQSVIACLGDVTDEAALEEAVALAVKTFGRLDIGVNAAGIGASIALVDQTAAQFQRIQDINLTGVFIACKMQARQMITQGGGVIVNFASTNAVQPGEGLAAYCASKAGVAMLTQVAAMELAQHNIRVVGIGPGLTDTPMVARLMANPTARDAFLANIPLRRAGQPADVAAAVAFLASDDAAYITGETLYVDGGALTQRYPSLADRMPRTAAPQAETCR